MASARISLDKRDDGTESNSIKGFVLPDNEDTEDEDEEDEEEEDGEDEGWNTYNPITGKVTPNS